MRRRGGFTMMEAVIATVIVAVMLTAALSVVGATRTMRLRAADRARGEQLAMDLMTEILQLPYQDPAQTPVLGLEPGESATSRAAWNDVDDYNGWSESPPQTKGGTVIPDFTGWSRSVVVEWIDPTTLTTTNTSNTGVKRITVKTSRGSMVMATVQAYRTSGWTDTTPSPTDATSNHPPTASISVNAIPAKAPFNANFDGSGSSDQDNDSMTYVWTFGDGSSGSGAKLSHTYSTAGTYTATLTVYDGRGGVGIGTVSFTLN